MKFKNKSWKFQIEFDLKYYVSHQLLLSGLHLGVPCFEPAVPQFDLQSVIRNSEKKSLTCYQDLKVEAIVL